MPHPKESEEWLEGLVESWIETYKKAMLAPVILDILRATAPVGIGEVAQALHCRTGWHVTERGLYRTIQRLEGSGLVASEAVDAPRTGARRKVLALTPAGERYLDRVRAAHVPFGS